MVGTKASSFAPGFEEASVALQLGSRSRALLSHHPGTTVDRWRWSQRCCWSQDLSSLDSKAPGSHHESPWLPHHWCALANGRWRHSSSLLRLHSHSVWHQGHFANYELALVHQGKHPGCWHPPPRNLGVAGLTKQKDLSLSLSICHVFFRGLGRPGRNPLWVRKQFHQYACILPDEWPKYARWKHTYRLALLKWQNCVNTTNYNSISSRPLWNSLKIHSFGLACEAFWASSPSKFLAQSSNCWTSGKTRWRASPNLGYSWHSKKTWTDITIILHVVTTYIDNIGYIF